MDVAVLSFKLESSFSEETSFNVTMDTELKRK